MSAKGGGVYRIDDIVWDPATARLTVWSVAHPTGHDFDFSGHPLLAQVGTLVEEAATTGNVGSEESIVSIRQFFLRFVRWLDSQFDPPITSLDDDRIQPWLLTRWDESSRVKNVVKRILAGALGWVVAWERSWDRALVDGHKQVVPIDAKKSKDEIAYDPDELQPIIAEARSVLDDWQASYEAVLADLGLPSSGRESWSVTPQQMLAAAEAICAEGRAPRGEDHARWHTALRVKSLLTTGKNVTTKAHTPKRLDPMRTPISTSRHVTDLLASHLQGVSAAVLIANLTGLNLSSIAGLSPTQFKQTGTSHGALEFDKDRGSHDPVPLSAAATRLFRRVIAYTNFTRAVTAERMAANGQPLTALEGETAALLLVSSSGAVLRAETGRKGAERRGLDHLAAVQFRRLRNDRLFSVERAGRGRSVPGQSPETTAQYLARITPDSIGSPAVLRAQNAVLEAGSSAFQDAVLQLVQQADQAREDTRQSIRLAVNDCGTGGMDPSSETRPCNLGMLGCFLCPMARFTDEHHPAIVAAARLADGFEHYDREEWNARGRLLGALANATLVSQFSGKILDEAAVARDLPLVLAHYRLNPVAQETA